MKSNTLRKLWEELGYNEDTRLYGEDAYNFLKDNKIDSVEARYEDTCTYVEGQRVAFGHEELLEEAAPFSEGYYFNCRYDPERSEEDCLVFVEEQAYIGDIDGEYFNHLGTCPTLVVGKGVYDGYLSLRMSEDGYLKIYHNLETSESPSNHSIWCPYYTIKATHLPSGRIFYWDNSQGGEEGQDYLIDLIYDLPKLKGLPVSWHNGDDNFMGSLGDNVFKDCIFEIEEV